MQVVKESTSSMRIGAGESRRMMESVYERVRFLVSGNAVVVFTMSGCCMCHVVKQLLFGLGVGPTIVEIDRDSAGKEIHALLFQLAGDGQQQPVPAVFVGGKFLGGIETVMACHINGTLVPLLKEAGALWL
ncbi:glutaredoxin-C9-like [Nicotiana tabacum]|uniref:Glutaredoxin-C9-like n=2 Tax=Nicotiana TaxID=4085 RepID=A0A1S3XGB1_TOBAC|nr:PREDICTED: glutaredoxin-C9-like [Nicotiana sylvestris]XP_016438965.1 PREDICTED: glutaredoxin-C9-like [Nicotiana tabacum]